MIAVASVCSTEAVATVYNLRIADHHTYFVGGKIWGWDVWVHNASYPTSRSIYGWRDAKGRFTRGPTASERINSTFSFNRGNRVFLLEQGTAASGWKHIWDRHVDPTRFLKKSKFGLEQSESEIMHLLSDTIKHGSQSSYAGQTIFTKRIRQGANSSWYRATINPDGTVQTFHPLS